MGKILARLFAPVVWMLSIALTSMWLIVSFIPVVLYMFVSWVFTGNIDISDIGLSIFPIAIIFWYDDRFLK